MMLFLDLMMPDLSGYEVTRKIKGDETLKSTHIIVVSARTQQEDGNQSQEAGADDYINKPYDIRLIRQMEIELAEKVEKINGQRLIITRPMAGFLFPKRRGVFPLSQPAHLRPEPPVGRGSQESWSARGAHDRS